MAIALVQDTGELQADGVGGSVSVNLAGNPAAGSLLTADLVHYVGGTTNCSVSDNKSTGEWSRAVRQLSSGNDQSAERWDRPNVASSTGTFTVSVSFAGGSDNYITWSVQVATGAATSPRKTTGTALTGNGTGITPTTSGGTAPAVGDLVMATTCSFEGSSNNGYGTPSGYTPVWTEQNSVEHQGGQSAYKIATGAGAQSCAFTSSVSMARGAVIVVYEAATGGSTSPVESDYSSTYSVVGSVLADLAGAYAIVGTVTVDQAASYAVIGSATADLAAAYAVVGSVQADLQASYQLAGAVSADLAGSYAVVGTVETDLAAAYNIDDGTLTAVTADLACTYAVAGAVASDLAASYGIAGTTESDLQGAYAIAGAVAQDYVGSYGITAAVEADQTGAYSVLGEAAQLLDCSYAVIGSVARDLAAGYSIGEALARAPGGAGYVPGRGARPVQTSGRRPAPAPADRPPATTMRRVR